MGYTSDSYSDSYSDTESERSPSPPSRVIQKFEYYIIKYVSSFGQPKDIQLENNRKKGYVKDILEKDVLITHQKYKRTGKIGRNTDVVTERAQQSFTKS